MKCTLTTSVDDMVAGLSKSLKIDLLADDVKAIIPAPRIARWEQRSIVRADSCSTASPPPPRNSGSPAGWPRSGHLVVTGVATGA